MLCELIERMVKKELAFSKHSNQYKELVSNATEEVQKKNYGLVTYNKILQDNLKKGIWYKDYVYEKVLTSLQKIRITNL